MTPPRRRGARERVARGDVPLGRVLRVDGASAMVWREGHVCACTVTEPLRVGDIVALAEPADDAVHLGRDTALAAADGPRGGPTPRASLLARPVAADVFAADGDLQRMLADGGRRDAAVRERAALLRAIRAFFDRRDFIEVDTPAIALSPGLELHLDPIAVQLREGMAGAFVRRHLVTSPEYHCKRLLHAGLHRIYRLGKAFRSGERGGHHNPEFAMLEWYRAGEDSDAIIRDAIALLRRAAAALAADRRRRGDPRPIWRPGRALRVDFAAATRRFAGVRINDAQGALLPRAALAAAAAAAGVEVRSGDEAADILLAVFAERVEPALAAHDLVVIERWPAALASLARRLPDAPHLAERFEIYVRGVELANGFGELVDRDEQAARFAADVAERRRRGLAELPVDARFLDALGRGCPPAGGVALGVDRLLMALGGYDDIEQVLAFPFERA